MAKKFRKAKRDALTRKKKGMKKATLAKKKRKPVAKARAGLGGNEQLIQEAISIGLPIVRPSSQSARD